MALAGLSSSPFSLVSSSTAKLSISKYSNSKVKNFSFATNPISVVVYTTTTSSTLSTFFTHKSNVKRLFLSHLSSPKAASSSSSSSVESAEFIFEPITNVKFETALSLPGCSSPLSLLGTGYREKVFAIIGVKVYAVGLYANLSIIAFLNAWKGRPVAEYQEDPSFFNTIYRAPLEKALQIVLVRDIDGKTFWDALNDAISPRIKASSPEDESALSTFRSIFQERPLKKGTVICLTWLDPSKMLVSVSSGTPSIVDATIESTSVNLALFQVFFGDTPVAPSLKATVSSGLAKILI